MNQALQSKLKAFEDLQLSYLKSDAMEASYRLSSAFEMLSTEIGTEAHFTSHLNHLVEKLNKRRLEQDDAISSLRHELKNSYQKIQNTEIECAKLKVAAEKYQMQSEDVQNELSKTQSFSNSLKNAKKSQEKTIVELNRTTCP